MGTKNRGRLQSRITRYFASAVVVSLVVGTAGVLVYRYYSSRQALESSARNYAGLVSVPVAQIADFYGESGLREPVMIRVARLMDLNPDVERLDLVSRDGRLVFSATREEMMVLPWTQPNPDGGEVQAVGENELSRGDAARRVIDGRTVYQVVVPRDEDGESISLSLVARFN